MKNMNNLKHLGAATIFIYPSKDKFIGVCLELDLIDEDRDKEVLRERMKERVRSYINYIERKFFDDSFLNRPAPKKYWNKFYQFLDLMKAEEKKHIRSTNKSKSFPLTASTKDFSVSRQSLARELA